MPELIATSTTLLIAGVLCRRAMRKRRRTSIAGMLSRRDACAYRSS